jgi:hypothetical protein
MRKVTRYEVVEPHDCDGCGQLIGQLSKTRAWLMPPADRCPVCDSNLAALFVLALWDDLHVIHVERPTDATEQAATRNG